MASIFQKVLEWVRWIFGVVPKSALGSPRFFLALHYTGLVLITVLLSVFSKQIRPWLWVPETMDHLPTWLNSIWCGPMFLLMYAIVRVVLYLIYLLGIEDDVEFPDIDADWNTVLAALTAERLPIDNLPLFLVNGLTPQQEKNAFHTASDVQWRVIAPPVSGSTPTVLRAYAREDAIYLCCSGIGTTSFQLGKVSDELPSRSAEARSGSPPPISGGISRTRRASEAPAGAVMPAVRSQTKNAGRPTIPKQLVAEAASPAAASPPPKSGGFFGTMAPGALRRAMQTVRSLTDGGSKGFGKKRLAQLSPLESQLGVRRMQFLCRLIQRARKPYIGINGMLQAVPLSWATSTQYAGALVPSVRDDLVTVHNTLQLQFPVIFAITELDSIGGVREFLKRADGLDEYLRLSRAGSSYAAGAELNEQNSQWIVDRSIGWFRDWVYTAFARDLDGKENPRLFQMLCEIGQRREGLVKLLSDAIYRTVTPNMRLHGVYFAATGEKGTEQGFVRGIIDKLPDLQSSVAWTQDVMVRQNRARFVAAVLYVLATVMVFAAILIYYYKIREGAAQ